MSALVPQTSEELSSEAKDAEDMLRGRIVARIWRHRPKELGIEFTDGSRLFVDGQESGLELSITGTEIDETVDSQ